MDLAHLRDVHRRRKRAVSERRRVGAWLDVDDDVAAGERVFQLRLDEVRDRVALTDGCAGRNGDHDIGEGATRGLAEAKPGERDGRLDPRNRRACRRLGFRRRPVHQHVDVPTNQPAGGEEHQDGHEERRDRVAAWIAGRRSDEAGEDGERSRKVAAEMNRVRAQGLAAVASRRAERDDGAGEIDREHDRHHGEQPPRCVDRVTRRSRQARDGEHRDGDADERQHGRLRKRSEMLRLPVPVLVPFVGRPTGDADGEEREQGRDEIRSGVQRLGDQTEAAADQAGAELERREHRRRADRDERGSALRRHAA